MKPENDTQATELLSAASPHSAHAQDKRIGTLFEGQYQITAKLGSGLSGTVYQARVSGVGGRSVALKILGPRWKASTTTAKRLVREGETLAALSHPNLLQLERLGVTRDGRPFLVTELVEGMTLRQLLASSWPLPPDKLHDIAMQLGLGLGYAHAIGQVVHRDLKPDNILVTRDGRVKIIDFGLVKSLARVDITALTEANTVSGSPAYMAPEQITDGDVSYAADLYSVGCLLYECLTSKGVFHKQTHISTLCVAHLHTPPKQPTQNGQLLKGPLVDLVMQCLAKHPKDRPRSAHTLVDMLSEMDPKSCFELSGAGQQLPDPTLVLAPAAPEPVEATITMSRKDLLLNHADAKADFREFQRIPVMSPEELALPSPSAAMAEKMGYLPAVPERWQAQPHDPAEAQATVFLKPEPKMARKSPWLIASICIVVLLGVVIAWLSGCGAPSNVEGLAPPMERVER